jgi:uncharacterized protein with von Willebrand factor type A (vWA) domain
VRPEDGRYEL